MKRTITVIIMAIFVLTQASTSFALRQKADDGQQGRVVTNMNGELAAAQAGGRPLSEAKVLIVDSRDADTHSIMSAHLKLIGIGNVFHAYDGKEALEIIESKKPDLVITEVTMPHVDGWELTRIIASAPETADKPVIVVSSLTSADALINSIMAGADTHIVKPFDPEELTSIVKNTLLGFGFSPITAPAAAAGDATGRTVFVVTRYSAADSLENWIRETFSEYIKPQDKMNFIFVGDNENIVREVLIGLKNRADADLVIMYTPWEDNDKYIVRRIRKGLSERGINMIYLPQDPSKWKKPEVMEQFA